MPSLAELFRHSVRAVALLSTVGLAACTVTPLYSAGPEGASVRTELAAIAVLPAGDRLTQIVRNELVFVFGTDQTPRDSIYELSLSASSGEGPNVPAANVALVRLSVTVRYALIEVESGDVVTSGTASADTSYHLSNQGFANLRAREDAEARAARAAADKIRLEVATALVLRE